MKNSKLSMSVRQQIDSKLRLIEKNIGIVDSKILHDELENISKYKPLTLLYFNVLAKLYCYEKEYDKAFVTLLGKESVYTVSEENLESIRIFSEIYKGKKENINSNFWRYLSCYISDAMYNDQKSDDFLKSGLDQINLFEKEFYSDKQFPKNLYNNIILYKELWRFVESIIMLAVDSKVTKDINVKFDKNVFMNEFINCGEVNSGFLYEQLINTSTKDFILVADGNNDINVYYTIAKALRVLGKNVFLITEIVTVDVEHEISMLDTVNISLENTEKTENCLIIRPIAVSYNGQVIGDNISLIIDNIVKNTEDNFAFLITTTYAFDVFYDDQVLNGQIQRLSAYKSEYFSNFIAFGYVGKYISYINRIYGCSYLEDVNKESEYEFSIVIPARNSAYTLRYTLQTCLEQRGMTDKDYEIIISDNSDPGNDQIYNLITELNDNRIKYYRTPHVLPINRNFEFAFGKARGEMIIPIGSDDGILPWGLEVLRDSMKLYPDEDLFSWDRGFFYWSQVKNNVGQAGQFIIPSYYKKGEYDFKYYDSYSVLVQMISDNAAFLYSIPLCYINSGFRRRYIKKILAKTNRLWDGFEQDVYMGVVNLLINEKYLNIKYPITIAGMSDNSLGALSSVTKKSNVHIRKVDNEVVGTYGFGTTVVGRYKFQSYSSDTCAFFQEIFRLLEINSFANKLLPILERQDWKKTFAKLMEKIFVDDLTFFRELTLMKKNSEIVGESIAKWFSQNLYRDLIENIYTVNENKEIKSCFFTGFSNGLCLDAKKFGVNNIYEATKLFENIANL